MLKQAVSIVCLITATACSYAGSDADAVSSLAGLLDGSSGENWPAYGRTYGEQHFSPLTEVNRDTVGKLGLAWSHDLPPGNPVSGPIVVNGVLFTATGYSVVRAFDAAAGKLLWTYDSKAAEVSGQKLRQGWGIRGLAWWDGKIIVGTQDGRLIGLDAADGKKIWEVMTVGKDDLRFISGPPRVFDGKVIIGHGGADSADTRGYVTTYDADTGKQLWRFYTVPGNPADGFENAAMERAAKTWAGKWWEYGGGGTVWNTFTYDPETNTIFLGTGNGAPWNHRVRSDGKGDNLFLCSVIALDANTGEYKWHYQFNPAESWDFNASMDMQLADIEIDGKRRKVLIELPKNGFLYVIDRTNGKLISAEKVARINWADSIDPKTGRPVENPRARFPGDQTFAMFPALTGAHTWLPSAYSPETKLVYLPVSEIGFTYDAKGYGPGWRRKPGNVFDPAIGLAFDVGDPSYKPTSAIVAWDPARRKEVWRKPTPGGWTGGILASGGGLVFQGDLSGRFHAIDALTGKVLWQFDAHVPVLAPPITYSVKGKQYVTVMAGMGTSAGNSQYQSPVEVDYHTQPRRILTFALGGTATIPDYKRPPIVPPADSGTAPDKVAAGRGGAVYGDRCMACHGAFVLSAGTAPDLRTSAIPVDASAFDTVVRKGALVANGMPDFPELSDREMTDLRAYIRAVQGELRSAKR